MNREFFRNVLPAMVAFAFSGVYSIVDGWFIGNYLSEEGLAAINLAWAITSLILATGTAIGMGGAIYISISTGRGQIEKQKSYMGVTMLLLFTAAAIETAVIWLSYPPLLSFFGASEGSLVYDMADEYTRWIIAGTLFQILGTGLVPVVRNFNGATVAMISMVSGFLTNVVLDWLFIAHLELGLKGAALATVSGQAVAIIPSLAFLAHKGKLIGYMSLSKGLDRAKKILKTSVSPFGLTYAPNVILIIINKSAMIYGGESAVACYAVVAYMVYIVQMLIQGVGDGSQPLISRYYGEGNREAIAALRKKALSVSIGISVVSAGILVVFKEETAAFFGMTDKGIEDVSLAMPFFATGCLFIAVERVAISVFYAMEKSRWADILIYGELVLMMILATKLLPELLGLAGLWLSVPVSQLALMLLAVVMLKKSEGEKSWI